MTSELYLQSATELAEKLRAGETTSEELVKIFLARGYCGADFGSRRNLGASPAPGGRHVWGSANLGGGVKL